MFIILCRQILSVVTHRRTYVDVVYYFILFYIVRMGYLLSVCVCVGFAFAGLRARVCAWKVSRTMEANKLQETVHSRRGRCVKDSVGRMCALVEFRRRKSRSHTARRKWLIAAASYLSRRRVFLGILSIRPRSVADILENNNMILFYYIRRNVNRIV